MPTRYYQTLSESSHPAQINAIISRIKMWIAEDVLYDNETYADALDRILMTNVTVEMGNRANIGKYKKSNLTYPYTLYNIGEIEPNIEVQSSNANIGNYYSDDLSCYLSMRARTLTMPMFSFFSNGLDYSVAFKKLDKISRGDYIRLWTPITINSINTYFPLDIVFTPAKGNYGFEFEQWLTSNRLYDIEHTLSIRYFDIISDANINEVDDIVFEMNRYYDTINISQNYYSGVIPDDLAVSVTSPVDEATDIPVDNSVIITFNNSIIEENFENHFEISPFVECDCSLDDTGKIVLMDPINNLSSGITYSITVSKDLLDVNDKHLNENYDFNFVTES